MGEIREYSCRCGYRNRAFVGAGMHGCSMHMVAHFFPEESATVFREREKIKTYLLKNALAVCNNCEQLVVVPQFVYQRDDLQDMEEKSVTKGCPACGKQVIIYTEMEHVKCPKCGTLMEYEVIGSWD